MKKRYAALFICSQALSSPVALADTLLVRESQQQDNIPEKVPSIVEFTGAFHTISEGLNFTHPEQVDALAAWLKKNPNAVCSFTGHASWGGNTSPFIMQLTAARIETVMSTLRARNINAAPFSKEPRGGLDYLNIGNGDPEQNKSVLVNCDPLISWAPWIPFRQSALTFTRASL